MYEPGSSQDEEDGCWQERQSFRGRAQFNVGDPLHPLTAIHMQNLDAGPGGGALKRQILEPVQSTFDKVSPIFKLYSSLQSSIP